MNVALKKSIDTGADRRAFGRRETHMAASVRLPNHTHYDCIIRDISEGGALLEFPQSIEISGRLRLSFDGGSQELICDVRHVRGNRAGVQFARNITLAARPVAEPAAAQAPSIARHAEKFASNAGYKAASEIVALRRKAAKLPTAVIFPVASAEPASILVVIPCAAGASAVPRDMTGLSQSVAALAAMRAVPRPLPPRAYVTVPLSERAKAPDKEHSEQFVPRDMSSLLASVWIAVAARSVPWPLPASAYAIA